MRLQGVGILRTAMQSTQSLRTRKALKDAARSLAVSASVKPSGSTRSAKQVKPVQRTCQSDLFCSGCSAMTAANKRQSVSSKRRPVVPLFDLASESEPFVSPSFVPPFGAFILGSLGGAVAVGGGELASHGAAKAQNQSIPLGNHGDNLRSVQK